MTRPLDPKRPVAAPTFSGLGPIHADAVYPLSIVGQRLGLGKKSLIQLQRDGLRTAKLGHRRYCLGRDVLLFLDRLADAQAVGEGRE